jgi:hypothetical protein
MSEQAQHRFEVVVEEGVPRGGLYELEQTTYYLVIDRHTGHTVLIFEGKLEASLSTETGMWEGFHLSGVREVGIAEDGRSALVRYGDGREERVPLPG